MKIRGRMIEFEMKFLLPPPVYEFEMKFLLPPPVVELLNSSSEYIIT